MRELTVGADEAGGRLDKYLQNYMAKAPKSFFYKMFRKKNITCNGKKCEGNERLSEGDVIRLFLSEETIEGFREQAVSADRYPVTRLDIVYEDSQVLVINKPAGMLSQRAGEKDLSLVEYLTGYLLKKGELTGEQLRSFHPSVCNRLDRNTSGLITAGKTLPALRELSALLKERQVKKYYLCLVDGIIREPQELHGFLRKDERTNQVQVCREAVPEGSEIHTAYEPLSHGRSTTLLKVDLLTGRSHQIRAHLASIGHPVIGDAKYGNSEKNRRFRARYGLRYQLLHAWEMEFPPLSGVLSGFSGRKLFAEPPGQFLDILSAEGISLEAAHRQKQRKQEKR